MMILSPGVAMNPPSRWRRYQRTRFHRFFIHWFIWHGTEKVAWYVHRWTKWAEEPNDAPRWIQRICGGLTCASWTHVCGHGLRYSFDIGCIYWWPQYAKRRLRLP